MVDNSIIQNPSQTLPFPYYSSNKGEAFNAHDANVYPYSYNLKIMTYDTSSNITRIDFYKDATSFSVTGSLVFSHQLQYSGSNATHILVLPN